MPDNQPSGGLQNEKRVCGSYLTGCSELYEPGLCTHVFHAFSTIGDDFRIVPPGSNTHGMAGLKRQQPGLKVLVSFGGWENSQGKGGELMGQMMGSPALRTIFIDSVAALLESYDLDGIDLDCECIPELRNGFSELVKELRRALDGKFLLTAAVFCNPSGYDVPVLSCYLDFVNLMAYDFGVGSTVPKLNSPLHGKGDCISKYVGMWIENGMPREKIVVGFPAYGRGFVMKCGNVPCESNPLFGKDHGSYDEISRLIGEGVVSRDCESNSPCLVVGNVWISYEDPESYETKLDWILKEELLGAYIWSLSQDRKLILHKTMRDKLLYRL